MTLGNYQNDKMGLDETSVNLNYIIYLLAIFMFPLLIINIFMGITIHELNRIIYYSRHKILYLQFTYALKCHEFYSYWRNLFSYRKMCKIIRQLRSSDFYYAKKFTSSLQFISQAVKKDYIIRNNRDEWKETMEKYMRELVWRVSEIEERGERAHRELITNREYCEQIKREVEMNRKETANIARKLETAKNETIKMAQDLKILRTQIE